MQQNGKLIVLWLHIEKKGSVLQCEQGNMQLKPEESWDEETTGPVVSSYYINEFQGKHFRANIWFFWGKKNLSGNQLLLNQSEAGAKS